MLFLKPQEYKALQETTIIYKIVRLLDDNIGNQNKAFRSQRSCFKRDVTHRQGLGNMQIGDLFKMSVIEAKQRQTISEKEETGCRLFFKHFQVKGKKAIEYYL